MSSLSRRHFLRALPAPLVSVKAGAAPAAPNVVLVITDDQGYGDLACHGNRSIRTPALDQLHGRSVRFTNFHVSPTCAPTRAALMTGRYNNATGVWHTIMGRSLLRPGEVTMADCFRASGYRTGIFGKWHLGDNHPCRPQDRGFDEVLIHGGGGVWQTPDYFGNDYFDDTYSHNGRPRRFSGFCTDVWFDNAMRFMRESAAGHKPFFCYLSTNAPHGPMWAPERYSAPYQGLKGLRDPGFYGMIANLDGNMARLARFLEDSGLASDTIFIFMTDNGTAAGANVFNASMRGSKGSPYEGGHRVPFFLSWPKGGIGGGRDIGALAAHIDVLPTLTELCGLKRPASPEWHGRSLKPLLGAAPAPWPDRVIAADSQRLEQLVKWRQCAVMTEDWRLVNPSPDGDPARLELYAIRKDPGQKNNIIAEQPGVAARLKAEYEKWWSVVSAQGDEYVRISIGSPAENPVRLTAHDWHTSDAEKVWNQGQIRRAPAANGFWAVDVKRAGAYRFELRRWPRELGLPINALYHDSEPNRETAPGVAISAVNARIRIGMLERETKVSPSDAAAVFELKLAAGPAELQTWFTDAGGAQRGAYYVYATYLERT